MDLEKELLEIALRNHGNSTTVQRVISMEAESALPKGENYLSTIYRITLKVVLGNGRTAKKSLILKVVPPEKAKTELVKSMGVFKSETMMYTIVLREMEALMEEFGDTNDVLWCRLLHYEPYTSLLLEDLKAGGFRMTRRQDCLDLDHSLLVLRSLGRFHGMAKILEQRGIITRTDYKPYPLTSDKNLIKFFMYYGLQTLSKAMEESWGPEWYDVAQKLKIPCDVLTDKMLKLGEIDETKFNCLNHGDCWSNNMMFKYDWQNRPYTMRFLDLQLSHYNSPVYDIMYCMYTSVDAELRRKDLKGLLQVWHKSLMDTLDFYGYTDQRPTVEDILEQMRTTAFNFRIVGFMIHMLTRADASDAFDLEVAINSVNEVVGYNIEICLEEKLKRRLGPDLKEFAKFIDLQLVHYGSYAFDLSYALYTTFEAPARRRHYVRMLKEYATSLKSTLDFFGYTGHVPTADEVIEEMERIFIACIHPLVVIRAAVTREKGIIDMETILQSQGKLGQNPDLFDTEFRDDVGPDLVNFVEKFYSD